jgi:glycosyltransferase involved in cell wall biosynthesis
MDVVVAVSHAQAAKVRRAHVADRRVTVIHDSVSVERFATGRDAEYRSRLDKFFDGPNTFIFGAAGRLSPEKRFDLLIDAAHNLRSRTSTAFGVVLFGSGRLEAELQGQIDRLDLGRYVKLAGFTTELDKFMPAFDAFVQSSRTEGLPNVLLEASAAGVPIVATDVGGTSEAVIHDQTGLIVPPGDADAIAGAMWRVMTDESLGGRIRATAPRHVAENFGFDRHAAAYRSLLATLLNGGR